MPRGNPNFKKKEVKVDIPAEIKIEKEIEKEIKSEPKIEANMEDIVAKAVAEALEKQKVDLMTKIPEVPKKVRHNFIPDHSRVRLHTNVDGKFIINDTRGQSFFYELNGYKDSVTISFKELKNYHGKNYTLFTSGKLAIIDVIADSEVGLDDVIRDLNLTNIYFNEKKVSPIDIEELFSNQVDINEFENKVRNSVEIAETIVEVGYTLYKQGVFSDNNKMNFLRQQFRDPNLFTR